MIIETDGLYYINRCTKCQRVVTKIEIARSNSSQPFKPACPCGSRRTSPSNLKTWENFLPRVIWLTILYWLGRIPPAPVYVPTPAPSPGTSVPRVVDAEPQDEGYVQ